MKMISMILAVLFSTTAFAAEPLDVTKVSAVKNVVNVDANSEVRYGDLLSVGTTVEGTSPNSVLQFEWHENKVLLIGKFKIKIQTHNAKNEPNLLNLMYGNMRALISKNNPTKDFKVKTPAAVAGVRGTDFMVTYGELLGETEVICFESEIDFQDAKLSKKPIVVKKGQWGGHGGRFGEIKKPMNLPENVLKHFKDSLKFN